MITKRTDMPRHALLNPDYYYEKILGVEHYYDKQREINRAIATQPRVAVLGANGCIGGETRIDNADTGEAIKVSDIRQPMPVWSYTPQGVVRAMAGVPFIKGHADLYRIKTRDGHSFVATGEHRVLTGGGWQQVDRLAVGSRVLVPPGSFSAASPRNDVGLATHSGYSGYYPLRVPSSRADCPPCRCFGGGPLLVLLSTGQPSSPLRAGVPACNHDYPHEDAPANVSRYNHPYRRRARPSNCRSAHPHRLGDGCAGCQGSSHQNALSSYESNPIARPVPSGNSERGLQRNHDIQHPSAGLPTLGLSEDLSYCPISILKRWPHYTTITAIDYLRHDIYYDLTVPGSHNYLAEGIFHHNTGKDWNAGRSVLWWLGTHYPAIVVVLGPTTRQVSDIVFKEARLAYSQSRVPLGGTFLQDTSRWKLSDNHYAIGFATDDAYNIQGFHSPHLYVIVTEAHNMPQEQIEAIKRLNPECILMTGNPFCSAGEFYDAFNANSERWATIRISAFDTPNVQVGTEIIPGMVNLRDIEDHRLDWGEDSALYVASVLGEFPDNLEDTIVARSAIMAAVTRKLPPDPTDTVLLSCDVARFGTDRTVVYRRQGHRCRKLWDVQGHDTQQIAGQLVLLAEAVGTCKQHRAELVEPLVRPQADCDKCRPDLSVDIIVDETGIGAGVVDRLNEQDIRGGNASVSGFNGGEKADANDRYINAIGEAWLELGKAFKNGMIDIDDNPALIAQLSSRRYKIQGDRRLALETKADYKKRSHRSPDDADALAMAYSPLVGAPALRFFNP